MTQKDKNERKAKLSQYIDLGNGRFKDSEIEQLESLVEERETLDGSTKTYKSSYKSFDSEDTYQVEEKETYTFRNHSSGIRIDRDFQRDWDDGQRDEERSSFTKARDVLKYISKIKGNK